MISRTVDSQKPQPSELSLKFLTEQSLAIPNNRKSLLAKAVAFFVFAVCTLAVVGVQAAPAGIANVNKKGIALDGYDPVSYFSEKAPVQGKAEFSISQDGATYLFMNDANKQLFAKDPKKYEPQFGGWCAYAVADSKSKVEVDPKSYLIQDGRLLLFYNGVWADTKKKWQTTKDKDSKAFLKQADANWPEVKSKEP